MVIRVMACLQDDDDFVAEPNVLRYLVRDIVILKLMEG